MQICKVNEWLSVRDHPTRKRSLYLEGMSGWERNWELQEIRCKMVLAGFVWNMHFLLIKCNFKIATHILISVPSFKNGSKHGIYC